MKKLLPVVPLIAFLATSCQQNSTAVKTLPPIVEKRPVVSKPKNRSYRTTRSKPKTPKIDSTATTITQEEMNPLAADPLKVTPEVTEIPRFQVPENLQPKVSDGINQAEFIELKW